MSNCKTIEEITKLLREPFDEEDLEWRIQRLVEVNGSWKGIVVPYVENRAIQKRFDDVFGIDGWYNTYIPIDNGFLCGITCRINGKEITKYDGAEMTDVEQIKGGLSNSMKRAAVQWGVGRYLYGIGEHWVDIKPKKTSQRDKYINDKKKKVFGYWTPPSLSKGTQRQEQQNNTDKSNKSTHQDNQQVINYISRFEKQIGIKDAHAVRIFNKATGKNVQNKKEIFKSNLEDLKKYYQALKPVSDIMVAGNNYGFSAEEMVDFARIVKPEQNLQGFLHLFFNLSKEDIQKIISMAKAEAKSRKQQTA